MTNSEELSSPEGIPNMKGSETFVTQHNQLQLHHDPTFVNYPNGDLKQEMGNRTHSLPFALCTSDSVSYSPGGAVCNSSSSSASSSSSSGDGDIPYLSSTYQGPSSSPGITISQQQQPPQLPFTLICGEALDTKYEISDGILVLTDYRLFVQTKETSYNLPLGLVESAECRDIFFILVNCKDARCIKCTFLNNEAALEALKRIQTVISSSKKVEDTFAFTFFKSTQETSEEVKAHLGWDLPSFPTPKERFDAEIKRMGFNVQGPWRVSDENKDYELCTSYPTHIIVPCVMDKKKLEQVACFRSARRIPAVVWRHRGNGAVISRCSQPEVGWFGWRSAEDEELVQNIVLACADNERTSLETLGHDELKSPSPDRLTCNSSPSSQPGTHNSLSSIEVVPEPPNVKKLLILDARSYSTAVVNRARGGGCECLEYYTNCEIQFMSLANIHSIRKSFINVRQLCSLPSDQANNNWFSQLESCKWLQHMSGLMKAAVTVATAVENEGRPVMVHCSDGWDRTPQIVALAEILLDPYYRSMEGFQILVEREWLDFGHKFADRCGQGIGSEDSNERCPVFLQWLDCLHQLIKQFPTAFEFNLTFLVKLAQHTYSNLFGTFLCNTAKERHYLKVHSRTHSIWQFLRAPSNFQKFRNHLYANRDKVLWPCCEVRELRLWKPVYLGYDNPVSKLSEVVNPSLDSSPAPSVAADCEASERIANCKLEQSKRSSSCENLHLHHLGELPRRRSDPSLSESMLGLDSDVESHCLPPHTEKMLTAASRDIDKHAKVTSSSPMSSLNTKMATFSMGDPSEFEDPITNSKEEIETNGINGFYLKSIESSTDTLVAETTSSESAGTMGLQQFNMEVNSKTEQEKLDRVCLNILKKTEPDRMSRVVFPNIEAVNDGSGRCDKDKTEACESILYFDKSIKEGSIILDGESNVAGQHCEICAHNRKLCKLPGPIDHVHHTNPSIVDVPRNFSGHAINGDVIRSPANLSQLAAVAVKNSNSPIHSSTPLHYIEVFDESAHKISKTSAPDNGNLMPLKPYDVDGLKPHHDEVQTRLHCIISGYKGKIETLEKELQRYRNALIKQLGHKCSHHMLEGLEDSVSIADSQSSMEHHSVGNESHTSEISWEAVDEKDTRPPLWLPDYAVSKCMGCEATFWLGKRKHHCRMCGKVYCADCSENTISIPSEQLFSPVRVCSSCYNSLSHQQHGIGKVSPNQLVNGSNHVGQMNGLTMSQTTQVRNGHLHRGSISEHSPPSDLPFTKNSLFHRRMSEDLPRNHQPWGKSSFVPDMSLTNREPLKLQAKVANPPHENGHHRVPNGSVNPIKNGHVPHE